MKIVKGHRVYVFQDPITCQKLSCNGTVTKVHRKEGWCDVFGNDVYLCNVRFDGERNVYQRNVSMIVNN